MQLIIASIVTTDDYLSEAGITAGLDKQSGTINVVRHCQDAEQRLLEVL